MSWEFIIELVITLAVLAVIIWVKRNYEEVIHLSDLVEVIDPESQYYGRRGIVKEVNDTTDTFVVQIDESDRKVTFEYSSLRIVFEV